MLFANERGGTVKNEGDDGTQYKSSQKQPTNIVGVLILPRSYFQDGKEHSSCKVAEHEGQPVERRNQRNDIVGDEEDTEKGDGVFEDVVVLGIVFVDIVYDQFAFGGECRLTCAVGGGCHGLTRHEVIVGSRYGVYDDILIVFGFYGSDGA